MRARGRRCARSVASRPVGVRGPVRWQNPKKRSASIAGYRWRPSASSIALAHRAYTMMHVASASVTLPCLRRQRQGAGGGRRSTVRVNAVATPPPPTKSDLWTPSSWRSKEARQMPVYDDAGALNKAVEELRRCPPLIFAGEVRGAEVWRQFPPSICAEVWEGPTAVDCSRAPAVGPAPICLHFVDYLQVLGRHPLLI